MTAERWAEIEKLVDAAFDLPSHACRKLFERAFQRGEISAPELDWLAAACENPESLLDRPALECFPLLLAPPTADELAAELRAYLAGRYQLGAVLGEGGMATVYVAYDSKHDREVAVKVLRPDTATPLGSQVFLREIQLTARLDHPYILPLLDSGSAGRLLFYVMPRVRGETLRERLRHGPPLSVKEAVEITREIAEALDYAHACGIVHRDVKPENVLLADDHVRITDFGIARALSPASGFSTGAFIIGTPAYMSPEQRAGRATVDGRSDIYSLACVLHEMLMGVPPTVARRSAGPLRRWAPLYPVRHVRADVPAAVEGAVNIALAHDPSDRFPRAKDFGEALTAKRRVSGARRIFRSQLARAISLAAGAFLAIAAVVQMSRRESRPDVLATDPRLVAVLPFRVTPHDSSYNYLREGVIDLLNAQLTGDGVARAVNTRTTLSVWRRAVARAGGDLSTEEGVEVARLLGAGQLLLGDLVATPGGTTVLARVLWQIAVLRGRVAEATQNVQRVPPRLRKTLTTAVALVDPAFDSVAGTLAGRERRSPE